MQAKTWERVALEPSRRGGIEELYQAYAPDAQRLAYLLTGDRALAEDLAQEAFVRMLGRFRDLRNPDAFWWYLRKTIVNLANSYFRRRRLERGYLDAQMHAPPVTPSDNEGVHDLRQALLGLRLEQRTAIVLRYYEDLTEAQTAEIMQCPVGTVKSLVSRGMERLRTELSRGG